MDTKVCSIDWCDREAVTKGYCKAHYRRLRQGVDLNKPFGPNSKPTQICSVNNCSRQVLSRNLCPLHYQRQKTGKSMTDGYRTRLPKYQICQVEGCVRKPTSKGMCHTHRERLRTGRDLTAPVVSPVNAQTIDAVVWREWNGYLYGSLRGKKISQHRAVWEHYYGRALHPFENIHHINGIKDDNRIENLELWVTPQPAGQRPEDLAAWVVENYRDLVEKELAKKKPRLKKAG